MGNIGDAFTTSLPLVGSAGSTYATNINAILTEVMLRLSTRVPIGSLNVAGDLNMAGNNITNIGYASYTNQGSPPGVSPSNRWTAYNGDAYWISPSGVVQVTSGGALNASGIGGITGAYGGTNPAQFRYDNANTRYDAYANFSTNTWAYVRALGFDVAAGATSGVWARLAYSGASTVTYTLPPAAPVATRPLQMSSSGAITAGFTSLTLTYSSLAATYLGNNAGSITGNSGGTSVPIGMGSPSTATGQVIINLTGLQPGWRITSVTLLYTNSSARATVPSWRIYRVDPQFPTATTTQLASGNGVTTAGVQSGSMVLGTPETVLSGSNYYVWYDYGTTGTGNLYWGCSVTLDYLP